MVYEGCASSHRLKWCPLPLNDFARIFGNEDGRKEGLLFFHDLLPHAWGRKTLSFFKPPAPLRAPNYSAMKFTKR